MGRSSDYIIRALKEKECQVVTIIDIEESDLHQTLNSEKYDAILLYDILECINDPKKLLENLHEFLSINGYLVGSIHNIAHGSVRLQLLNGDFNYNAGGIIDENKKRFFTLSTLLLTIESFNYSIKKLKRIQRDFFETKEVILTEYTVPQELLDAIYRDPEALTYQYVFCATVASNNAQNVRRFVNEFSKNICTEYLINIFLNYRTQITINPESNHILEIDRTYKLKLAERDSEISNLQDLIVNYQKIIKDINQSFVLKMLHRYDNVINHIIPLKLKRRKIQKS